MTKLIVTIKDSYGYDDICSMIQQGVNYFRLNAAHLTGKEIIEKSQLIKRISNENGQLIKIFIDLPGSKSRIWYSPFQRMGVNKGDNFKIFNDLYINDFNKLSISNKNFFYDIKDGDILCIRRRETIKLVVTKCSNDYIEVKVLNKGYIGWGYHIIIEGRYNPSIELSQEDNSILPYVLHAKPDFICASFADTASVMKNLRKKVDNNNYMPKLLAKIESKIAIYNLLDILNYCDGAVIGRDDLSAWLGDKEIQEATYDIINICVDKNKIVIPASNYFNSLCEENTFSEENYRDIINVLKLSPNYIYCNETNRTNCWQKVLKVGKELVIV